jgi:hypothetical protein
MKIKQIVFAVIIAIVMMVATWAIAIGLTGGIFLIGEM